MTKTRQVAQRAKVEGGGVALTGRMWWNLVGVTRSCWCVFCLRGTGLLPPRFVEWGRWSGVTKTPLTVELRGGSEKPPPPKRGGRGGPGNCNLDYRGLYVTFYRLPPCADVIATYCQQKKDWGGSGNCHFTGTPIVQIFSPCSGRLGRPAARCCRWLLVYCPTT